MSQAVLKLGVNLGGAIADLLASAGHDVATVRDQPTMSAPDSVHIAAGSAEGQCFAALRPA